MEECIEYEPYILNDANMSMYLKYKLNNTDKSNNTHNSHNTQKSKGDYIKKEPIKSSLFFPKETDSLFWCYYIISSGETSYEMMNVKNFLVAKQMKINYVTKIRTNKPVVKIYKFDSITNIESNLANDNCTNIKSIMTLCAIDKINIIFVKRNTYYELLMNDTEPIYIIREVEDNSKYSKKYGFEIANQHLLEEIRTNLYKVESLDKPLKALSTYKVQDLIDICNKLAIGIKQLDTGKNKTKNELYESLIQYF
jgi:hypothetical protein